ncbi:hypothetical protein [Nocardia farcinica]|uniref:hypothetical protein n=1 Tax=Nocardia farcinica TaxID=37329 RepID=UPI001896335B|nr:hypothetical protein [Nocardia farcinica]MBF6254360.1 hypothetical protein [Nocardia farcinica]
MTALILTLAVLGFLGLLLALGHGLSGSSPVVDRDAQRVRAELDAIAGRLTHHR